MSTKKPFRTIVADPPWTFNTFTASGRGHRKGDGIGGDRHASAHYDTMSLEDICALDVKSIADADATLLLWTSSPFLAEAMQVIERWGFTYKSAIYWVKAANGLLQLGMGYHARACCEPLLIASRGNVSCPAPADRPAGALVCPRGRHSAKPDDQYKIAEGYPGPYVEIFSRHNGGLFGPRPNWTFLGNEIDGLDIRDAIARQAAGLYDLAGDPTRADKARGILADVQEATKK